MPRRLIAISIFLTLWVTGAAYAAAPPIYYLALGDSLARGVQPDCFYIKVNQTALALEDPPPDQGSYRDR